MTSILNYWISNIRNLSLSRSVLSGKGVQIVVSAHTGTIMLSVYILLLTFNKQSIKGRSFVVISHPMARLVNIWHHKFHKLGIENQQGEKLVRKFNLTNLIDHSPDADALISLSNIARLPTYYMLRSVGYGWKSPRIECTRLCKSLEKWILCFKDLTSIDSRINILRLLLIQ